MTTLAHYLNEQSHQFSLDNQLIETVKSVVDACVSISQQVRLGALSGDRKSVV